MSDDENNWERFCANAAAVMRDAQANKITLEEATIFFKNSKAISDPDLRRYVEYMIWEIGGSPDYYTELAELFESRTSQQEMVRYLNTKKSFTQTLWSAVAFWRRSS